MIYAVVGDNMFNGLEIIKDFYFIVEDGKILEVGNRVGKEFKNIEVIDLPGAYSIRPYTSEESITTDFIKNENPDVIINVVDSTNLN
ncbi:MAG: FeoB small GTPase domain-containing protein, partial [Longicatena sp.]